MDGQVRKNVIGHLSLNFKGVRYFFTNTFWFAAILNKLLAHAFMKTVSIFGKNKDKNMLTGLLADNLETATIDENSWRNLKNGGGSTEGKFTNRFTIKNLEDSVREDVQRIRKHPLVSKTVSIYGYIFDVKTGKFNAVQGAVA